jgi:pimeloyl-ACP methyl ester carboxylesterase
LAPLRLEAPRHSPIAFGWLVHRKIDRQATDSYVLPAITAKGPGDDVRRVLPQFDPGVLLDATAKFGKFTKPVLIAWSEDDKFFPPAHAERLAAAFPDARVEWIADSRTFSSEDQPERVAELVGAFAAKEAAVA